MTISKKGAFQNKGVTGCGSTSKLDLKLEEKIEEAELFNSFKGPISICKCGATYRFDEDLYSIRDSSSLTESFEKNGCPHCYKGNSEKVAWAIHHENMLVHHHFDIDGNGCSASDSIFDCLYIPEGFKATKIVKTEGGYKIGTQHIVFEDRNS